jgi:hypothetical protein
LTAPTRSKHWDRISFKIRDLNLLLTTTHIHNLNFPSCYQLSFLFPSILKIAESPNSRKHGTKQLNTQSRPLTHLLPSNAPHTRTHPATFPEDSQGSYDSSDHMAVLVDWVDDYGYGENESCEAEGEKLRS